MPIYQQQSEGSWTPTFSAATPPTDVTYTTQTGRWVRQGSIVYYEFLLTLSNKGSGGVGTVAIDGLPFAARSGNYGQGGGLRVSTLTFPGGGYTAPTPRVLQSTTTINISLSGSTLAAVFSVWADWANTTSVSAGGWYLV